MPCKIMNTHISLQILRDNVPLKYNVLCKWPGYVYSDNIYSTNINIPNGVLKVVSYST